MSNTLLAEFYSVLPDDALQGGLDWPIGQGLHEGDAHRKTETRTTGKARLRAAIHIFSKQVRHRYTEGTLLRVLQEGDSLARRAAVFALGLIGTPAVNDALAGRLHDNDSEVARLASDALWSLWFRGDNANHSDELYRILRLRDQTEALALLTDLCSRAPNFAEAFNQRAILRFQLSEFARSAADCTVALRLNPKHFGAQAGLGQCLLHLHRHHAALRAFRAALQINPRLEGVACTIRVLESSLKDDVY